KKLVRADQVAPVVSAAARREPAGHDAVAQLHQSRFLDSAPSPGSAHSRDGGNPEQSARPPVACGSPPSRGRVENDVPSGKLPDLYMLKRALAERAREEGFDAFGITL